MATQPETRSTITLQAIRTVKLTNEEIIELLSFICSAESVAPYREHIRALRDKYDQQVEIRTLEVEVLSLRPQFPLRVLYNFYWALGDHGYHSLILDTIRTYQEDKSAAVYVGRLEEVFGVVPDDKFIRYILEFLYINEMDGSGASAIAKHYRAQLDRVAEYAPIPDYIRDFGIRVNELPHLQAKEVSSDMSNELIARYILTQADNLDLYIEDTEDLTAKDVLIQKLEQMNDERREQFVKLFQVDFEEIQAIQEDDDVFRVYGPVNAYPDTDFSNLLTDEGEPDVNVIFGGARMFTDNSLEYDYENDIPQEDWFVGYCLQCSARIRSYHHAVRNPNMTGGWQGCFCKWDCVRKYIENDYEHDPDLYNVYITKLAYIRQIEEDIIKTGIQDRDYEGYEEVTGFDYTIDQDEVDQLKANLPKFVPEEEPIVFVPTNFGEETS